jgi:glycyl-tRNA synthetase
METSMKNIISLAKRRGFIFPNSEIYGGMANTWDYGPLGVEIKNNIKQRWWKEFVQNRSDVYGLDSALITNPKIWEVSGHLGAGFADELVECKKCHHRFRKDQLPQDNNGLYCPHCQNRDFTKPTKFNLMFKTFIGPLGEKENNIAYLRPETAQGIFTNFKNIIDTTRARLPFGVAQIGKAFRNEITPGNFIFRTREFEQMEIEYFVQEKNWQKSFKDWQKEMEKWINLLGLDAKKIKQHEIEDKELAHYSKKTIDFEYDFPFGSEELYGLAYRTDYDLKNHLEHSSADLSYIDHQTHKRFIPHVIEPSLGVDRSILAILCEHYHREKAPTADGKDAQRIVMKLPLWLSPIKVAILPLSKKKELSEPARKIFDDLKDSFVCEYDETQSIGKRYRRQDEIGTPFCVTVDFKSLEDKQITIRERDSMRQERIEINQLKNYLKDKLS